LGCVGLLLQMKAAGKKTGVLDLTQGELGTRGSAELRLKEAAEAARILGLSARENLRFRDGFYANDETHQRALIREIRRFQPEVVISGAPLDRHPDHGRCAALVKDAAFLSGLRRIETHFEGDLQAPWRPKRHFNLIQDYHLEPDFVVDITPYFEGKKAAIRAYGSQFFNPADQSSDPPSYISSQEFWHFVEARARVMGHMVGAEYGEGFISETPLKVNDLSALL
ncbi:MAG: bacillithiol biosynthesis deacetylase BshB1, partial [Bacteroidetes bacterium]